MADKRSAAAASSEISAKVTAGTKYKWRAKGNCTYKGRWYAAGSVIETDSATAPTRAFEAVSGGEQKKAGLYDPTAALASRNRTARVTSGMSPVAKRIADKGN